MIYSFTGTSKQPITDKQLNSLRIILEGADLLRHGDCIYADEQCHHVAIELGIPVETHPCTITNKRAFCKTGVVREHDPLPPLERNHVMVDNSECLIATPRTREEEIRSGTWATIRYARKLQRKILIIWPDGKIKGENF